MTVGELFENGNFSESSLGIGCMLKSIENLFESNELGRLFALGLPNVAVCSLPQFFDNLEFLGNV